MFRQLATGERFGENAAGSNSEFVNQITTITSNRLQYLPLKADVLMILIFKYNLRSLCCLLFPYTVRRHRHLCIRNPLIPAGIQSIPVLKAIPPPRAFLTLHTRRLSF